MNDVTTDAATAAYLALCEEHLRDLPDGLRAQLRQDIEEIVLEVCAELDGAPIDLVGPPLRFVGELRAAAGHPPPPALTPPPAALQEAPSLRTLLGRARSHRATTWVRDLLPELRAAWWVARGYLVAVALGRVTGGPDGPEWLLHLLPYWPVLGSRLVGLVAIGAGVYVSVETGRERLLRRHRFTRLAASLVAVVSALSLTSELRHVVVVRPDPSFVVYEQGPPSQLTPPFRAVQIGSELTGERAEVLGLADARAFVDRLLQSSPPAAVYIERHGTREAPGTRDQLDQALQGLFDEGLLNP